MIRKNTLAAALLSLGAMLAHAQTAPVTAEGAWARASVPGQKATGAFLRLTSREALKLVGVESPAAGVSELHEMKMDGQVMRMRAIPSLDLPAGKAVELRPGGHHLMLMDLKGPLKAGSQVPVVLSFRDAQGKTSRLELSIPVAQQAPGAAAAAPAAHDHSGHKH